MVLSDRGMKSPSGVNVTWTRNRLHAKQALYQIELWPHYFILVSLDTFRLLHKLDAFGIRNEGCATTVIKIPTGIPPHILVLMLVLGERCGTGLRSNPVGWFITQLKASLPQRDGTSVGNLKSSVQGSGLYISPSPKTLFWQRHDSNIYWKI